MHSLALLTIGIKIKNLLKLIVCQLMYLFLGSIRSVKAKSLLYLLHFSIWSKAVYTFHLLLSYIQIIHLKNNKSIRYLIPVKSSLKDNSEDLLNFHSCFYTLRRLLITCIPGLYLYFGTIFLRFSIDIILSWLVKNNRWNKSFLNNFLVRYLLVGNIIRS